MDRSDPDLRRESEKAGVFRYSVGLSLGAKTLYAAKIGKREHHMPMNRRNFLTSASVAVRGV
jgi:hypothetical protein